MDTFFNYGNVDLLLHYPSSPTYVSPFMTLHDDYKPSELNSPNMFGDSDRQSKASLLDLKIETAVSFP